MRAVRRREFVRYAAVGTVGALAALGARFGPSTHAHASGDGAHDHGPGDPEETVAEFEHKGRKVKIRKGGHHHGVVMEVDGRELSHHALMKVKGGYASHLLPFGDTKDPVVLATALLDADEQLFVL